VAAAEMQALGGLRRYKTDERKICELGSKRQNKITTKTLPDKKTSPAIQVASVKKSRADDGSAF